MSGLVNRIEDGTRVGSLPGDPGQVSWYGTPSKSASVPAHPVIWMRVVLAALKQKLSSSVPLLVVSRSCTPSVVQFPKKLTALQYSKCPISSENAMLYEWAAHGTRVCSLAVLYIGWKA